MPTPARKNTPKAKAQGKSKTPEMKKTPSIGNTPKSAPQVKRKKLQEEIDEELSDEDFEALLGDVRKTEKQKKMTGKLTPLKMPGSDGEEDDSEEDDSEDNLQIMDDAEDDDEDEEEDDKDDDDEEEDDEKEGAEEEEKAGGKVAGKESKVDKKQSKKKEGPLRKDTLYINHLTPDLSPDKIKSELTSLCPKATWISVPGRKRKGKAMRARGFALVKFANEQHSKESLMKLQGTKIGDLKISVEYSRENTQAFKNAPEPAEAVRDPCRLYIGGKSTAITEENLRKLFPAAVNIDVPTRKRNESAAGFGFVTFKSAAECGKAHKKYQDSSILPDSLIVRFARKRTTETAQKRKIAEPKGKKAKTEPASKKQKTQPAAKKAKTQKDDEMDSDDDEDDGDALDSDDVEFDESDSEDDGSGDDE